MWQRSSGSDVLQCYAQPPLLCLPTAQGRRGAARRRARARRYNTYRFGGAKRVVLSTAGWLGGRNVFLGAAYLAVGGASLLSAAAFFLLAWRLPRRLGDPALLSWHDAGADGGGAYA